MAIIGVKTVNNYDKVKRFDPNGCFDTADLAGTMMRLGTDVKWPFVNKEVRAWLTGVGDFPYNAMKAA